ncbi:uncharacterized protein ISCGN_010735 [Ixodes scapularis]
MLSVQNPKSTFVLSLNLQAIKYRVSSHITRPQATGSPKSQPCISFSTTSFEQVLQWLLHLVRPWLPLGHLSLLSKMVRFILDLASKCERQHLHTPWKRLPLLAALSEWSADHCGSLRSSSTRVCQGKPAGVSSRRVWWENSPYHTRVRVDATVASSHDAFMRGLSTGLKQPSGKGQRLIVTHIGSDEGFVDGCLDVFRGQNTRDYHEEMDGTRFEKWFDGVLDKLPTGSVIVMDNASYHSRRMEAVPTTSSRKDDIRQWLTSKKNSWDPKMLKKQLLDIVALVKSQHLKYRVDTATETAGGTVVRLPPYHCEFNHIELIGAQIKNGVAARNTTF